VEICQKYSNEDLLCTQCNKRQSDVKNISCLVIDMLNVFSRIAALDKLEDMSLKPIVRFSTRNQRYDLQQRWIVLCSTVSYCVVLWRTVAYCVVCGEQVGYWEHNPAFSPQDLQGTACRSMSRVQLVSKLSKNSNHSDFAYKRGRAVPCVLCVILSSFLYMYFAFLHT